jgi:hypothetical protein
MKEKLEKMKEKVGVLTTALAKIAVILVALILGFVSNEAYHSFTSKKAPEEKIPATKTHLETSVAINERNEIIILDRSNGEYVIYSDSVGLMIFNHYASKMYYKSAGK